MPMISDQEFAEFQRLRSGGQQAQQDGMVRNDTGAPQPAAIAPRAAVAPSNPGLSADTRAAVQRTQELLGPNSPFQYNPATHSWGPKPGVMSISASDADTMAQAWQKAINAPQAQPAPAIQTPQAGQATPPPAQSMPTVPPQGSPMAISQRDPYIQQQQQLQVGAAGPSFVPTPQPRTPTLRQAWEQQAAAASALHAQGQPGQPIAGSPAAFSPSMGEAYRAYASAPSPQQPGAPVANPYTAALPPPQQLSTAPTTTRVASQPTASAPQQSTVGAATNPLTGGTGLSTATAKPPPPATATVAPPPPQPTVQPLTAGERPIVQAAPPPPPPPPTTPPRPGVRPLTSGQRLTR